MRYPFIRLGYTVHHDLAKPAAAPQIPENNGHLIELQQAIVGQAFVPPSTVRLAPVMYDASGPATNATIAAMSSTDP
jgi:hypothetical protein